MSDSIREKIDEALSLRASGYVKRWHTIQHVGAAQTIAEHSAQALSLLLILHPDPSPALVKALLWHDSAEREVGDTPAPVLRANPEFAAMYKRLEDEFFTAHPTVAIAMLELSEEDQYWLKAIDRLELVLWCADQIYMGNRHCEIVMRRAVNYILSNEKTPSTVRDFVVELQNQSYRSFA